MEETEIKDLAKRYFPNQKDEENACYLAIVEALGKKGFIPLYINIEIPPDKIAKEIFIKALDEVNGKSEGVYKIEIYEWSGWCISCHSLRMKICPIIIGRFFDLGKVFWRMYESEKLKV